MKRILSITGLLLIAILILSSFSLRENPQDQPPGKKGERHIKIVTVDEQGKKTELDTLIEGDNVFVFNGDTVGDSKGMKWFAKEDFDMDFDMNIDIDVKKTADGKVIIMKTDKDGKTVMKEIKINMNGLQKDIDMMRLHMPEVTGMPHPPYASRAMFIQNHSKKNIIDLSDPGIISYNKKKLKDGTEKITIVRKQVPVEELEFNEEFILHGDEDHSMFFHEGHPGKTRQIKIIEDGKLLHNKKGFGDGTYITDEEDIFHIKESQDGDKMKIEVRVEEKIEEEEE